ncbi:uncharacterized protein LOC134078921 [Sardina pilchardus]|uniref:uncharacterized protein LOC134078921 n=1 Tax=Sardina pilchardus TaxID=27697 RepID=UPI002E12365A
MTCILMILLFAALPLSMASQINTIVGQSVLLPCFIPPLKDTRVYWQTPEDSKGNVLVLHFINMGVEDLERQAPQYQNRTALDLSQVAAGNLSLELRNVTEMDNQTTIYCLWSRPNQDATESSRITLTVLQTSDVAVPFSNTSHINPPITLPKPDVALPLSMASQINATVGQSVLLPCSISPLKDTRVYWKTAEDTVSLRSFQINATVGQSVLLHLPSEGQVY